MLIDSLCHNDRIASTIFEGGITAMSPEIESIIIKVAGEWAIELAKGYHINKKYIAKFLTDTFKWSYDMISSTIEESKTSKK